MNERVLLVEDDPAIVSNLTEFLQKEGFFVANADGQTQALDRKSTRLNYSHA